MRKTPQPRRPGCKSLLWSPTAQDALLGFSLRLSWEGRQSEGALRLQEGRQLGRDFGPSACSLWCLQVPTTTRAGLGWTARWGSGLAPEDRVW